MISKAREDALRAAFGPDIAKDAEWLLAEWITARHQENPQHSIFECGARMEQLLRRLLTERANSQTRSPRREEYTYRNFRVRRVVYIAHPLGQGAMRAQNIRNAMTWSAWAAHVQEVSPSCSWQVLAQMFPEHPQFRQMGLECDLGAVENSDEVYLCGGWISEGMKLEEDYARERGKLVWDLSRWGQFPPGHKIELEPKF
jgi:hypothetical protein